MKYFCAPGVLGLVGSFGLCVALLIGHSSPLVADDAKEVSPDWVWAGSEPAAGETIVAREVFDINSVVTNAELSVAGDDHIRVFLNGEELVRSDDWRKPVFEDVRYHLRDGKNVLAIYVKNDSGPAGVIFELKGRYYKKQGDFHVVSGEETEVLKSPKDFGWAKDGYKPAAGQWKAATSLGALGAEPWGDIPLGQKPPEDAATPVSDIDVPKGFAVDLVYSVPKGDQGSWVALTPDDRGGLIASDQYGSLYRVTPAPIGKPTSDTKVTKIPVNVGSAQGLLVAYGGLYVVRNGNSGLFKVTDSDGDGEYDSAKKLTDFDGGGEHGPHAIRKGPDGRLWVIAGNHTSVPTPVAADSPHNNFEEDLLLPRNPDGRGHATGRMAPGGWIAHTDPEATEWVLHCAGYRNPYDIAFNRDGELFTFDADMEWDTGTPWYRPTRVNHAISGAEFGWRFGTGKWPEYYPDSFGSVVDIGLGSPTGIEFGYDAKFPAKYREALYINDWTYGKIYAVHMKPDGATYRADFETFVKGRPLPVTDAVVNPADGAFYFAIGGRRAQSGLYRVRYVGDESTAPTQMAENPRAEKARMLRHKIEEYHRTSNPQAVEFLWPHLNSYDRAIRYAARVAIENQPLAAWKKRALAEENTNGRIQAMVALARTAGDEMQADVIASLNELPLKRLSEEQMLDALRAYQLAFIRLGGKQDDGVVQSVVDRLAPFVPHPNNFVSRELTKLLVYLEAPIIIEKSMERLEQAQTQQEQMFYIFVLRNMKTGWTPELRKAYFSWINLASQKYRGGASFQKFVEQIRDDAVAHMSEDEKEALADVISGESSVEVVQIETSRQFVQNWQLDDFEGQLDRVESGRSFENGKAAYEAAQCAKCHRFRGVGGDTGPDITGVGGRFNPQYLLESVVAPSKAISDQYKNETIVTINGEVLAGRVIQDEPDYIMIRTDPFARELTKVMKDDIDERFLSEQSEMPKSLINVLSKEEIFDLIAYLRSGGDPDDRAFDAGD
ncbi:c-type cytochrome [Stratiformator vulcanicus]|uniref:Cytochrome c n=1 Tax=Stratiformator vulcanicus TaxID=2527980 RepID=A0A517R7B6_9PLAN|nr:c-type cytochrome [Stratiformator vulcanicus]QDT39786.1 Cytochrome c [Stratiformator vulcanicus]